MYISYTDLLCSYLISTGRLQRMYSPFIWDWVIIRGGVQRNLMGSLAAESAASRKSPDSRDLCDTSFKTHACPSCSHLLILMHVVIDRTASNYVTPVNYVIPWRPSQAQHHHEALRQSLMMAFTWAKLWITSEFCHIDFVYTTDMSLVKSNHDDEISIEDNLGWLKFAWKLEGKFY